MKKNVPESDSPEVVNAAEDIASLDQLERVEERRFTQKLDELIVESEAMRLKRMKQHRTRGFIAMNVSILLVLIGTSGFGWFFLMKIQIMSALICLGSTIFASILLYVWAGQPIKTYKREHKTVFMPKMAKALNGLSYYPQRGISEKILEKLAVLPAHNVYKAEDCFMGVYKGVKVMFSEARLYSTVVKRDTPVFQGLFVLLEIPTEVIEGHTIITANTKMANAYSKTRWKSMNRVYVSPSNQEWDKFLIYSTKTEAAELMVGDKLLKELHEASVVFNNSPLTAVLFGKRFVFMMIPHDKDMFEASDMYVPVTTQQHALECKKEIEQLLEVIDVFDLYKPLKS